MMNESKDRLVELLIEADNNASMKLITDYKEVIDDNADHLLANGVIVPPCKVGDKVFFVDITCDEEGEEKLDMSIGEVVSFSMQKEGLWMYCRYEDGLTYWHKIDEELGKTVFLTKKEAEQALRKDEGK